MPRARPARPRLPRLLQNANIVEDVIAIVDPETPGQWTRRKQARRAGNVFESLHAAGQIDGAERLACTEMVELYARSKGVMGVGERSLERIQGGQADPHRRHFVMARHAAEFNDVLARLDPHHEMLLRAIIGDFVLGDGAAADEAGGIRWRRVVRELCQGTRYREACRNATGGTLSCRKGHEARPVVLAVAALPAAIEAQRRETRGRETKGREARSTRSG